jgi:hypothetical protein
VCPATLPHGPAPTDQAYPVRAGGDRRFITVQECLYFLPADERALTEQLREFFISEAPDLKESLSFNVPFYKGRRDVCFLWPASVLWGQRKTYDGVRFGFSYGTLLSDPAGYLDKGERKQVYWRDITQFTRTDERMLRLLLAQAVQRDQERGLGLR